MDYTRKTMKRG